MRTCPSAPAALWTIQDWYPDVRVSDIEMPNEDGYGRIQDRTAALTAGYNMHVPKPVDPGELTTIIASLVGRLASNLPDSEE